MWCRAQVLLLEFGIAPCHDRVLEDFLVRQLPDELGRIAKPQLAFADDLSRCEDSAGAQDTMAAHTRAIEDAGSETDERVVLKAAPDQQDGSAIPGSGSRHEPPA